MAEEQEQEGTWSGLKKTIIGVATTLVTAGGVWVSTLLGGGDKEATHKPNNNLRVVVKQLLLKRNRQHQHNQRQKLRKKKVTNLRRKHLSGNLLSNRNGSILFGITIVLNKI
jgi:flagellar basal body-associated protein FliL